MSKRAECLRKAIAAFDKGNLAEAANILEESQHSIDKENAVNCRKLAFGASTHMIQTMGYLLQRHLEMAQMFKE